MMKKQEKRLSLGKQTLRALADAEAAQVGGAYSVVGICRTLPYIGACSIRNDSLPPLCI